MSVRPSVSHVPAIYLKSERRWNFKFWGDIIWPGRVYLGQHIWCQRVRGQSRKEL